MAKVTVYTTSSCPFCVQAKELLKQRAVLFKEVLLGWDDDAEWEDLQRRSGMKTVPQVFWTDDAGVEKLIGGFQELMELDRSSGLDHLK